KAQRGIAVHPAAAKLGVEQPLVLHKAEAACQRSNPILPHGAQYGCRKRGATKRRPIKITFNAKQKMASLEIITGLNAADEFGGAAMQVARDVQAAARPRTTDIRA